MSKYTVTLSDEDIQMIKDCHSKNPSIMKRSEERRVGKEFSNGGSPSP